MLSRLESDLMAQIVALDRKEPIRFQWINDYVVGVMLASKGYPGSYDKGAEVSGFELNNHYFVSGLKKENDTFLTSGGRVVLAIGKEKLFNKHKKDAYGNVEKLRVINYFIVKILEIKHSNKLKIITHR